VDQIRLVVADDHAVVRAGLRMLLDAEDDFSVVAEAGEIERARRMVAAHRPDVLVLDLNMPGPPSLPAIPELAQQTAVVVLTMQNDPAFAREALQLGALGYVLKESADAELVQAIRLAAAGRTYLNPELGARMAAAPLEPARPPDDLTEREVEILRSPSVTPTRRSASSSSSAFARSSRTAHTSSTRSAARHAPSWSATPSSTR
jgi:two-component system, NarL family, response regulator NreC